MEIDQIKLARMIRIINRLTVMFEVIFMLIVIGIGIAMTLGWSAIGQSIGG